MTIAYCKIYPSIGIARVGNSTEFFIGPEAPGIVPDPGGTYKDREKRIKRQAARFRLYGFDEQGQVVGEITADDVEQIRWTVELANKKAAWYEFNGTDQVATILRGVTDIRRRNAGVPDSARDRLEIRPAPSSIAGRNQTGDPMTGTFSYPADPNATDTTVFLGELRTDERGRLLVLGGRGDSASVIDDNPLRHYANNDAWHDDVSDGSVRVEVTAKGGAPFEVRGSAWVVVAPPAFSPHTKNVVTLYDVLVEVALLHRLPWPENELGRKPSRADRVSFTRDIYPILERLVGYTWISGRAQRGHSGEKNGNFLTPAALRTLSDPAAVGPASLHTRIFERIRTPLLFPPFETEPSRATALNRASQTAINQANLFFMPPLAGDEGDVTMGDPATWLTVTELQYERLMRWQRGDFQGDWTPGTPSAARRLEDLPLAEQPHALIHAALESCQGGAFYPGIEITSIVRYADFYEEAFRVRPGHQPGDVTKWMALPWQADFFECRDHWWPTARPDDVVSVGEYQRIIAEFDEEREQPVSSLLIARRPWARGVVGDLPGRPGLPTPAKESPAEYRGRAMRQLQRFVQSYVRFFRFALRPPDGETLASYRRRADEFLGRTILAVPDFPFPPEVNGGGPVPPGDYHTAVVAALRPFLDARTGEDSVPPPNDGETTAVYARRLNEGVAPERRAWQGVFDVEWRIRAENRGKDDMVRRWNRLGFVVPAPDGRADVLVETDRDPFDLLSPRDSFYYMMNIEQFPAFTEKAQALAEEFLDQARTQLTAIPDLPSDEHYARFTYDEVTFRARLEKIYETERKRGEDYDPSSPVSEPLFRTPAHIVERIRQLAPFNQLDGSWLENVTKAGPIDDVSSFLFEIWGDEIGNGDPVQNHANVYSDLMHSAGVYLPPTNSRAYADHPDLWESSFIGPAYHASIAHFPETYFPELLGMTLYLEWEAILLPAMVKLYRHHGYNPLFYTLHVAIDNPVIGHGARARDAVIRYLNDVRTRAGEAEMQQHWQRIWDGYIAFRYIGGGEWQYRFTHPPTLEDRMIAMMERKRHYAQLNHNVRRLGANTINDWFDEPAAFLEELANSDLVVKGDAPRSKVFALFAQSGPMLKVFDAKDRELWAAWINSLPADPVGAVDPGTAMLRLVQQFSARATGVPEHGTNLLEGRFVDPETATASDVRKPVAWWLSLGDPRAFMNALKDPRNNMVIPGDPQHSRFVQELLLGGGRMSKFMTTTVPEVDDRPARDIVIDWIAAGCPVPGAEAQSRRRVTMAAPPPPLTPGEVPAPRIPAGRVELQEARVMVRTLSAVHRTPAEYRGLQRRSYRWNGGSTH